VAYLGLVPSEGLERRTSEKYAGIGWFPVSKLPPLAFDHGEMVREALQRLRYKLEYTNAAYSLLPEAFTLSDLQRTYETILARRLDPRNFRKRILSLGIVERTGSERGDGGAHRSEESRTGSSSRAERLELRAIPLKPFRAGNRRAAALTRRAVAQRLRAAGRHDSRH
jgi:8-oxo-dGTP diphosphatase